VLKEGMTFTLEKTVGPNETARVLCSGAAEVFSTPMLLAFMENTAFTLAENNLAEGESTVGLSANLKHLKANAVGDKITCTARLDKIEGKKLTFYETVEYEGDIVGEAVHERYIINMEKFMAKMKR